FKWAPGIRMGRLTREERTRKPLRYEDGIAIKNTCPSVQAVSIEMWGQGIFEAKYGNDSVRVGFGGVLPEYERVRNAHIRAGRFFSETDNEHRATVCVIGATTEEAIFPHTDPIDKEISVNNHKLRIVGVLEKRPGGLGGDGGPDRVVIVPYETFKKMFP